MTAHLGFDGRGVLSETNAEYASYNVDASYNRGFFHIDFANKNLRAAAASLAPSTLRFGGSGNDYLSYSTRSTPCTSGSDSDTFGCLNETHWAAFHGLAQYSGVKPSVLG